MTLGAQDNTYIVLNPYRQLVSNAEYDQTQAITTMAKAIHGVQASLVRLCNDRDGLPVAVVLTYKVDNSRLELPLQPPPARAVHRFGTTKPPGRRESAARSLTCADRCRVGGGAGAEDAKQEGATGWSRVGPPAWGPCRFHCLLACLPKINLGSRSRPARASTTKREMAGFSKAARPRAVFDTVYRQYRHTRNNNTTISQILDNTSTRVHQQIPILHLVREG
jgi:hypothetical protein